MRLPEGLQAGWRRLAPPARKGVSLGALSGAVFFLGEPESGETGLIIVTTANPIRIAKAIPPAKVPIDRQGRRRVGGVQALKVEALKRPDSVSRLSRFKSARKSEAVW